MNERRAREDRRQKSTCSCIELVGLLFLSWWIERDCETRKCLRWDKNRLGAHSGSWVLQLMPLRSTSFSFASSLLSFRSCLKSMPCLAVMCLHIPCATLLHCFSKVYGIVAIMHLLHGLHCRILIGRFAFCLEVVARYLVLLHFLRYVVWPFYKRLAFYYAIVPSPVFSYVRRRERNSNSDKRRDKKSLNLLCLSSQSIVSLPSLCSAYVHVMQAVEWAQFSVYVGKYSIFYKL